MFGEPRGRVWGGSELVPPPSQAWGAQPGAVTPTEDGKTLGKHRSCGCGVRLLFFFFPSPLIAAAILTEPGISLTIPKAYKCLMSLSLHAQAAASAGVWGKKGPDWSSGMGQRLQGEDPAPDPHGKAPSHPSAPVLSSPQFLEGDPTAQPPCNMALCCRNLNIEPKPSGGFAALRGIYSCRQTPAGALGAAGIALRRDPALPAAGIWGFGVPAPILLDPDPAGTCGNPSCARGRFGV